MNFENSQLTNVVYFGFQSTLAILTGWTFDGINPFNGDPNMAPYNSINLDEPAVNLEGTNTTFGPNAIEGQFSVFMQGGSRFAFSGTNGASIWQTGIIPASSISLTYWGGPLAVSFAGQALSFAAISNAPGYTVWGADISAYSGQTGELRFTVPWQQAALLDNIQFSSTAVPEPSALALLGFTVTALHLYRRRNF